MCLGIPGQIVEIRADDRALVSVAGVRREINIACVADGEAPLSVGEWVLVHVGFAMARLNEDEAAKTLALLTELGEAQAEEEAIRASG